MSKMNFFKNNKDKNKEIHSTLHKATLNSSLLNSAVYKAGKDQDFLRSSLNLLKNIKFPTYRHTIIDHIQKLTNNKSKIALFYTLDDSLKLENIEQIKNIILSNTKPKNTFNQLKKPSEINVNPLSNKNPNQKTSSNKNDKDLVPRSVMKEYTCKKCGKPFLTRDDLKIHREFEGG